MSAFVQVLKLGDDVHAGKTGVPAFVGIEWRDAHQAMHAAFGLAKAIGIFAFHAKVTLFKPAESPSGRR